MMRQAFKQFNRLMLWHWRLGMGPYLNFWPAGLGRFVVLVHRGRKSSRLYRTPVNYAEIDGDVYVAAGFGKTADWYRNIMAASQVELWLPDGRWLADAADVTDAPESLAWLREVLKGSGFAAYLGGIHPHKMDDETLATTTAVYRLLRLRRVAPLNGRDGPGDRVWLWPLLTLGALFVGLRWPRRRA